MHLTNVDVNKYNKNYIHPNDSNSNNENANMWNLLMYKKYLKEKHNFEWDDIRIKIKDIISLKQYFIKSKSFYIYNI